ncbi:MAG: T9SS type A sorting domain-containing protein [Ignavibacteriae bacterium]|nr:T9SS type A sorting domain-containing protein [Ignavibacteriota bacterium]
MKKFVLIILFVISYSARSQDRAGVPLAVEADGFDHAQHQHDAQGIPGCRVLTEANRKIQEYVQAHPEILQRQRLMKRTAWNFTVGSKGPIQSSGWWASDISVSPTEEYLVPSTCRAVGPNCYIFVEDALWNNGVTQAGVDSILAAWESRTPADQARGIYDIDVETFGDPPNDIDNDNRIIILILDIVDGFSGSGGYVAGYFYSINQYPDPIQGHRSNEAEIYYLDGKQTNFTTSNGRTTAESTTAHEFQHMINYNYNGGNIDDFSNESLSEVASLVCGYPYSGQNLYANNTDEYLFDWTASTPTQALIDYSRAARWALYLWNQFPNDLLKLWVQGNGQSITRLNGALAAYTPPTSRDFTDVLVEWAIANEVQDQSNDPRYGYTYASPLTKPGATVWPTPDIGTVNASVNRLAADYISFTAGTGLTITFSSGSSSLSVWAIKSGAGTPDVEPVTVGVEYFVPDFGTTYSEVTFVVVNTSPTGSASYSYTAGGTGGSTVVELSYDTTEPIGYLQLSPSDTVAVRFDAQSGFRLDSVRVALRRPGTMYGGVWTASQTGSASLLGTPLALPISVSTTSNPDFDNDGTEYPYVKPYQNWRTIDLRGYNIILDQPFFVGFWHSATPANDATVMVTKYPSETAYNSYAYLHEPNSTNGPGWYYLSAAPDTIYLFLIRAYASIGGTPVAPSPPVLATPANGATGQSLSPTLMWQAINGASSYDLQVADNQNFSAPILDTTGIQSTSHALSGLTSNTTYYWRVRAVNSAGTGQFSGAYSFSTEGDVPATYVLAQNFPNPFNPGTTISYGIPQPGHVKLQVFDMLGRVVTTLVDAQQPAGTYDVVWDGRNRDSVPVATGMYFYRLESGSHSEVKRLVVLR